MVYVVFLSGYDYKSVESIWTTFEAAMGRIKTMKGHLKTDGWPIILEWKLDSDEHHKVVV
jgi:hypothetical protein